MSKNRIKKDAGWVDTSKLKKGPGGRALCRWCDKEVEPPRRSFCSENCVHEHKIRSQPAYAREQVWKRDGGVCEECGISTQAVQAILIVMVERLGGLDASRFNSEWLATCEKYGFSPTINIYNTLWHMDHRIPVVEGGGECGLENLRTLCIGCHNRATQELRKRLSLAKRDGNLMVEKPAEKTK